MSEFERETDNNDIANAIQPASALSSLKYFFSGIRRIFSIIGKVFKGAFILLIIVGLLAWISLFANVASGPNVDIPDSGALRVELEGYLVDELQEQDPLASVLGGGTPSEHLLRDLINAIDAAAEDERINSMVLVLHDFSGGGSSKILELGEAINRFKQSGKPVLAAADFYTQQRYLLASFADEIYLNPLGGVELKGLGSYRSYYGDAFDKLKVNFHIFRTGEFKDAVEPFVESQMSESSANQTLIWLEDIWQVYRETITTNRNIEFAQLDRYADAFDEIMQQTNGNAALAASDTGLVDTVLFRDEILDRLISTVGANEEGDFYLYTNYLPYLSQVKENNSEDSPVIGLVIAAGTIADGSQPAGSIGGDTLSAKLKFMRETVNLAALVLRVDSPGGSAFASDLIRRELALYAQEDIPVVISMGSLAASGGYWISMPAEEIWATSTTLTGSIGVFGIVPTVDETLEAIGVRRDGVGTGPLANSLILDMPMSDAVASIIQSGVDHIYDEFLALVSDSRDISIEDLDSIAQGRVWTGNQALGLGLVDAIGTLEQAISSAAVIAGVENDYQVYEQRPEPSFAEQVIITLLDSVAVQNLGQSESGISSHFGNFISRYLLELQSSASDLSILLADPQHQYLFCSACQNTGGYEQP